MKLGQNYANSCSVDLDSTVQPNLPTQFFPLPADSFITIQNSSGMSGKDYDLWQDVVNLIFPYLEAAGISIVQIGKGNVPPLNKTINLVNQTNFAQTVFVLNNARLHAGNDSFACHAAYNTPIVALYGCTSSNAHSPLIFHKKSVFLESHRNGKNPSFQAQESPWKSVNYIPPELVANIILNIIFSDDTKFTITAR